MRSNKISFGILEALEKLATTDGLHVKIFGAIYNVDVVVSNTI